MMQAAQKSTHKKILPIGVDLGASAAKLVQLRIMQNQAEPIACGTVHVPEELRSSPQQSLDYLAQHIPVLLRSEPFKGKRCILALPAASTFVRHVKVPLGDAKATKNAARQAVQSELPFAVEEAVVRHVAAGEIRHDGSAMQEVIVVAMPMGTLNAYLSMVGRAGLEVLGVSVEPVATVECFANLLSDPSGTVLFIDMGSSNTQVTIAEDGHLAFSRNLPFGADEVNETLGQAFQLSTDDVLRQRKALQASGAEGERAERLYQPLAPWLDAMGTEVERCLRYYEWSFQKQNTARLVFTGGQAGDRHLCSRLAQRLQLPADLGDPMRLLASQDNLQGQPNMTVAVGLSLTGMHV